MKFTNMLLMIFQVLQLNNQSLIETTCSNTPNYNLCVATLAASPNAAAADVEGLALIMVDAVRNVSETALSTIEQLESLRPELMAALRRCGRSYTAVLRGDVPEAVAGLTKGVPKFADFGMTDAAWEAEICEGSFGYMDGEETPLSGVNKEVHELAKVAVAIIKNLL